MAFILILSGRSDRQVKRLLSLIYRRQHFYLIHVDTRHDYLRREVEKFLEEQPLLKRNVRLTDYNIASIWGGASILTVILRCIRELLEWSDEWDFVLNLSETDFPVKNVDSFSAYLANNKGKNFLGSQREDTPKYINGQALDQTFVECEYRMWLLGHRELPDGIRIDGGTDWIILDRKFANYSVFSDDDLVVGLKRVYQYTVWPGETFFHTLLHNSEFCTTFVNHSLRFFNWNHARGCHCTYNIVDWCGCSPNVFCATDVDQLFSLQSEPIFFARKFEPVVCNDIVDKVVDKVLNSRGSTADTQDGGYYWQNEYDWFDRQPPDTATMAMYQSWTRLAPKVLETLAQCTPGKMNLRRVEQVRIIDALKGIATELEFEATDDDGGVRHDNHIVQMMWTPRPFRRIASSKASMLLRSLNVGSKFDPKEDILRDVAAAFGPNSSLTTVVHMLPVSVISVLTFVWLDPEGSLAHLSEIRLSTMNVDLVANVELTLRDPLMAGSWTLQLYLNKELIGECVFVVLPINPLAMSPPRYNATALAWLAPLLKPPRHKDAPANALEWTDKLVGSLWTVEDICAIGDIWEECTINRCASTEWSAISSDPHRWFDKALADKTKN